MVEPKHFSGNHLPVCLEARALFYKLMISRHVDSRREQMATIRRIFIPASSDAEALDFAAQLQVPELQPGDRAELIRPDGTLVEESVVS